MVAINCSNIVCIKQLLEGMQKNVNELVTIYYDNTSAINILKNSNNACKTKHISIESHYLMEQVHEKQVRLEYVKSNKLKTYLPSHYLRMLLSI